MKLPLGIFSRTICVLVPAFALVASGCSIAGDYHVGEGVEARRSYRTIAGAVHVEHGASINRANTIAGDIEVEDRVTARSLGTIAGEIRIGRDAKIDGNVSTIAGNIHIGAGTNVTGEVTTVAGAIELHGCRVDGPVRLTKGSLLTRDATVLPAGIVVKRSRVGDEEKIPVIDIGAGADVASIEIAPKAVVELRISRDAHVGKITGTEPAYYP